MIKPREFWISQSKTWSDETKSYSIEKTSVNRITEESAQRLVMEIGVGIRVIEYSAYKELKAKLDQILEYCKPHAEQMWAARVAGIILDCEYRDVQSEIANIEETK